MPVTVPDDLRELRTAVARLRRGRERLLAEPADPVRRDRLTVLDRDLLDLLAGDRLDPCDASAQVPLVLLPVRVECKRAGSVLRVRITPDEIHVDAMRRAVTEEEAEAGRGYWRRRWAGEAGEAADPLPWADLVEAVGADRSAWVARALTPTNLAAAPAGEPDFPPLPTEITAGTVARCLPDRFVVRLQADRGRPTTVVGPPVRPEVPISPLAFAEDEITDADGLLVPAGAQWSVSFDQAQQAGLGIEVPLPRGAARIESLVVVGTRSSVPEADSARDLTDLLLSHACSDGFDLLAHGTPTNNADGDRSPYRGGPTVAEPSAPPAPASPEASAVARLLGLDAEVLQGLLHPGAGGSHLEAAQHAANTALWWATWAPVLAKAEATGVPGLTPATIESARRLHRDHVRAAGHSSALRVGAQPYGVLPVADLDRWAPEPGDLTAGLVPLVRRVLARWVQRAEGIARVRPGAELSDEDLLDVLGTSPTSTGVRARPAVDGPQVSALSAAAGVPETVVAGHAALYQAVLSQYSVTLAQRLTAPALHEQTRRIALPLVSERDAEVVAEILAGGSPAVDSVLQALLEVAWDEVQRAGAGTAPSEYVEPVLDLVEADTQLVQLALTAASTASVDAAVEKVGRQSAVTAPAGLHAAAAELRSTVRFEGQPTEAVSLAAIEPVAEARTSLAQVALDLGEDAQAMWIGQEALAGLLEAFAYKWEARDAFRDLTALPIAERRTAVASVLDLAAHRVDAWASGIVAARQRTLSEDGITIGAFGYLENIRLGASGENPAGWLHAPSPSHAVAEGMLASAHTSRIGATAGDQPFAIDLSSRRGTELRRVLEGIRRGQQVGALLGYQVERALTGSAARFQLTLRQIAPLQTEEVSPEDPAAAPATRMAAADVVDGAELLRRYPPSSLDSANPALRQRLSAPPRNAYIEGDWPAVTDAEWATVAAALRGAAETLDAVSDALLAESVLHYASGNAARAAAVLDASGAGGGFDPDLGVLGVRQPGRTLTHNAYAVITATATGWSTSRPRAVAEPRLEAWAARRLGPAAHIIAGDGPNGPLTLADAGLAALDLLFTDDLDSLARDLRTALPGLGDLATEAAPSWPTGALPVTRAFALASSLRAIAAGARPLTADRLVVPGAPAQHTIDREELTGRCADLLAALESALQAGEETVAGIDPLTHTVAEPEVAPTRAAVQPLAAFGVTLVPNPQLPTDMAWALGAWEGASARFASATAMLADLQTDATLTDDQVLEAATTLVATVLGDAFPVLPLLRHLDGTGTDLTDALTNATFDQPAPSRLAAFVRDHAAVHAGMGHLAEAQLLGRASGRPVALTAAQLTLRAEDGRPLPGTDRWLAGELPDGLPWPTHPVRHVVLELLGPPEATGDQVAGLLFDSWVEMLPYQPGPQAVGEQAVDTPLRHARATTGLAVHAHQASARAPQVILSAVSADGSRWTTDSVVAAVRHAIAVSKARLVTLENVPGDAAVLPATYVASPWLQARTGFDFSALAQLDWGLLAYPFVSEVD